MARLFLALWPDAALRARLAHHRDAWRWRDGAAVAPASQLHLTLHFIGKLPRQALPQLAEALQVRCSPFELALGRPESWPHGLVVLRLDEVPVALLQLHRLLGEALRQRGLPVDAREFRPHVTLARRAPGAAPPDYRPDLRWSVRSYVLVESVPGTGYRVVQDYPLAS